MDQLIGGTLGRYRVEAVLGHGGMAAVYRATDPAFERKVAIKVLNPQLLRDPQAIERFLREGRAAARLQHPHILPVYDVGQEGGIAYLVMPYVAGGTLEDRLSNATGGHRLLSLGEVMALLRPVALALDYAHQHGIIHRDVKPANILFTPEDHPFLADFGIAKALEHEAGIGLTATGAVVGTPEYISPEQLQGAPLDGRADLYALGVILFQALTGRPPFRAEKPSDTPVAVAVRHLTAAPPAPRAFNPALSPAIEAALLRALAKNPAERFPTGAALFDALGGVQAGAPTAIAAPTPPHTPHAGPATPYRPYDSYSEIAQSNETVVAAPYSTGPVLPTHTPTPAPPRRRGARVPILVGVALLLLLLSAGLVGALRLVSARSVSPTATGTADTAPVGAVTVTATESQPTPSATSVAAALAVTAVPSTPAPATPVSPAAPATPTRQSAAPGGRREVIVFSSIRGGVHDSQIFIMNPDGTGQRQLTFSRGHSWGPRISPDGRSIVFSSVAPGEHVDHSARGGGESGLGNHEIYLSNLDGSNITKLTNDPAWDNAWSWSPDGQWITFASDRGGNWDLYRMTPQGDQVTRLTENPAQDGWPSWTPNGKEIVFTSDRLGGLSQIYIINQDGSNVRRLRTSTTYDTLPFVSPDGKKIVFSAQTPTRTEGEIFVMNLDGSEVTRLTSTVAMNSDPSWSPDSSKIVFVSDREGNNNIYTMNADGTGLTRLTNDPGEDVTPSWGYTDQVAQQADPVARAWTTGLSGLTALLLSRSPAIARSRSWRWRPRRGPGALRPGPSAGYDGERPGREYRGRRRQAVLLTR